MVKTTDGKEITIGMKLFSVSPSQASTQKPCPVTVTSIQNDFINTPNGSFSVGNGVAKGLHSDYISALKMRAKVVEDYITLLKQDLVRWETALKGMRQAIE